MLMKRVTQLVRLLHASNAVIRTKLSKTALVQMLAIPTGMESLLTSAKKWLKNENWVHYGFKHHK